MTVYLPKGRRTYRYDFEWRGQRHWGSTGMSRQRDAEEFERKERVRLERQAGDLSLRAHETPRFHDWAETFYAHKVERKRIKRPELLEREINVVLEFCGPAPSEPKPASTRKNPPPHRRVPIAPPYHDLRLGDFIENPEWITEFERWMLARRTGGSARNHYRSVMSGFYKIAMMPEYRRATGVRTNPFAGIERDRPTRRRVTQTVEQLRAWVEHASPHIRLALAIGALMPALRLGTILALRWDEHIDHDLKRITVHDHKGDQSAPEPIVIPISKQLALILTAARAAWETARMHRPLVSLHVVQFRGRAIKKITKGLREAARRAKVPYGIKTVGGATFHTLRHTMSTMLAEMGVPEAHRKELLAQKDISTTQIYTHLRPMHLVGPLEQLSGAVPMVDLMVGKPAGLMVGKPAGARRAKAARAQQRLPARAKRAGGLKKGKRQQKPKRIAPRRRAS